MASSPGCFLPIAGVEHLYRQSLAFGVERVVGLAEEIEREAFLRQPVGGLTVIARVGDIHFAQQAAQILRPELGVMIEEARAVAPFAGFGVGGDDLAFPLGIQDIREGFEFARARQRGMVAGETFIDAGGGND